MSGVERSGLAAALVGDTPTGVMEYDRSSFAMCGLYEEEAVATALVSGVPKVSIGFGRAAALTLVTG